MSQPNRRDAVNTSRPTGRPHNSFQRAPTSGGRGQGGAGRGPARSDGTGRGGKFSNPGRRPNDQPPHESGGVPQSTQPEDGEAPPARQMSWASVAGKLPAQTTDTPVNPQNATGVVLPRNFSVTSEGGDQPPLQFGTLGLNSDEALEQPAPVQQKARPAPPAAQPRPAQPSPAMQPAGPPPPAPPPSVAPPKAVPARPPNPVIVAPVMQQHGPVPHPVVAMPQPEVKEVRPQPAPHAHSAPAHVPPHAPVHPPPHAPHLPSQAPPQAPPHAPPHVPPQVLPQDKLRTDGDRKQGQPFYRKDNRPIDAAPRHDQQHRPHKPQHRQQPTHPQQKPQHTPQPHPMQSAPPASVPRAVVPAMPYAQQGNMPAIQSPYNSTVPFNPAYAGYYGYYVQTPGMGPMVSNQPWFQNQSYQPPPQSQQPRPFTPAPRTNKALKIVDPNTQQEVTIHAPPGQPARPLHNAAPPSRASLGGGSGKGQSRTWKEVQDKNKPQDAPVKREAAAETSITADRQKGVDEVKTATAEDDAKKQQAEADAKQRESESKRLEIEAKQKAAEEQARLEAEAKHKAEEDAKRKAEDEAKEKAEQEAKLKAEEEAKQQKAEKEAKQKAEEEAKRQAEEVAKRKAEEEAKLKAEEAKLKAEEEARLKVEAEAKRIAEEEAARKAMEEAKRKAVEEAKRKAEEEAKRKAAEEEALRKAEEEALRKAEEEAKRKAEEEAKQKADRKAEEETKRKAEEEAKRKAEEEVVRKAEEEAKRTADKDAKRKAEEKAKLEEERSLADEVARRAKEDAEDADPTPFDTSSKLSAKAKRKAALSKAETQGTGDMMDAYTVAKPKEAAKELATTESDAGRVSAASTPRGPVERTASDVDDWEHAADAVVNNHKATLRDDGRRRYTRDYLMKFEGTCMDEPEGLEHIEPYTKAMGGGGGPPGGLERRGSSQQLGMGRQWSGNVREGGDDRWAQRGPGGRGPMGPPPGPPGINMMGPPLGPGGRPVMGGPPGGPQRGPSGRFGAGINDDRWERRGPPAGPPGWGAPPPQLHKTENAYKAGVTVSDDPEEEKKQKAITALLNKLTPDNFDRIYEQIVAVEYTRQETLKGLIDKVFDKALTEVTFTELYADLVHRLQSVLPEFDDPTTDPNDPDPKKITFRRVLLNKCQEEFEAGQTAFEAVKKRQPTHEANGETEEGEITEDVKRERKEQREEAARELQARRRMLGNIQFIGQLYKKRMLTERIMHDCIRTLLAEEENPKTDDVECLCKLMSTIGMQLDSVKNAGHMSAYIHRLQRYVENGIENRLKFAILDVVDMRNNNWQARRKVEGPKKITEIHQDAQKEAERQRERDRLERRGSTRNMDSGGFGRQHSGMMAGRGAPPPRMSMDTVDAPIRAMNMNKSPSTEDVRLGPSLRPGGAMGRAAPARGPSPLPHQNPPPPPREARPPTPPSSTPRASTSTPEPLDEKELNKRLLRFLEGYSVTPPTERDAVTKPITHKELEADVKELLASRISYDALLLSLVRNAVGTRGVKWPMFITLLVELGSTNVIPAEHMQTGLRGALNYASDMADDNANLPTYLGEIIGDLVGKGVLSLSDMLRHILSADNPNDPAEEDSDPSCIDSGVAVDIACTLINRAAAGMGPDALREQWEASGIQLQQFFPSFEREDTRTPIDSKVEKKIADFHLQFLSGPSVPPEEFIYEAAKNGDDAVSVIDWVDKHVSNTQTPEFIHAMVLAVLRGSIPNPQAADVDDTLPALVSESDGYNAMLRKYISRAPPAAQMAVVYAAQEFFYKANKPKGLMTRLLKDLYNSKICTLAVINRWRDDGSDKVPGKQDALFESNRYLSELEAADAEGEDDK